MPKLKSIFAAERVPEQLVWVAEVESGFNPERAQSGGRGGLVPVDAGDRAELGPAPLAV